MGPGSRLLLTRLLLGKLLHVLERVPEIRPTSAIGPFPEGLSDLRRLRGNRAGEPRGSFGSASLTPRAQRTRGIFLPLYVQRSPTTRVTTVKRQGGDDKDAGPKVCLRHIEVRGQPDDSGATRSGEAGCRAGRKPEQTPPGTTRMASNL